MASLDSLPADQRAVLQLVLQRGRSYDDIATLLKIERAAVRERALSALDALGPQTGLATERRALITDYLLGQLPPQVAETTRERLSHSSAERAWARVVASELAPIASGPLPEIPVEAAEPERRTEPPRREPEPEYRTEPRREPEPEREPARSDDELEAVPSTAGRSAAATERRPRSSRRGGALLLGLGGLIALAAIAAVVIILVNNGGSKHHASATTASHTPTTGTTTTPTRVVGRVNLSSPGGSGSTKGIAEVIRQGNLLGIALVAQNVPANSKSNAYAVWLYNSPTDAHLLGFVNARVGNNGRLSTAGQLPSNASRYKNVIVTLETQATPHQPGQIILSGPITGLS
jgi:hypothetical protein